MWLPGAPCVAPSFSGPASTASSQRDLVHCPLHSASTIGSGCQIPPNHHLQCSDSCWQHALLQTAVAEICSSWAKDSQLCHSIRVCNCNASEQWAAADKTYSLRSCRRSHVGDCCFARQEGSRSHETNTIWCKLPVITRLPFATHH